jgi:hypothetical protein
LTLELLLIKGNELAVLVSTQYGKEVWENSQVVASKQSLGAAQWIQHPTDPSRLLLVVDNKFHIYQWNGLERETVANDAPVVIPPGINPPDTKNFWLTRRLEINTLVQACQLGNPTRNAFMLLDTEHIKLTSADVLVACIYQRFISGVKEILGISRSSVVFLSCDGWICFSSMKAIIEVKLYIRHSFIPPFWRTGEEFLIKTLAKNSVAVACRDDLIVIHGSLDFYHKVIFDAITVIIVGTCQFPAKNAT